MYNRTKINLNSSAALSVTSFPIHFFVPIFPFPIARVRPPLSIPSFIPYSSHLTQAPTAAANELFFSSETPFSFFLGRQRFLFRRSPKKSLLLLYFIFYLRLFLFFFCFNFMILNYHSPHPSQKIKKKIKKLTTTALPLISFT